jgi:acyl-CoA reductase-like NAD-dependent aldehyde dehydrogenase
MEILQCTHPRVSEAIEQVNDTTHGLAAAVFTQNLNRAIESAHKLHAGTAWVVAQHRCLTDLSHKKKERLTATT